MVEITKSNVKSHPTVTNRELALFINRLIVPNYDATCREMTYFLLLDDT
jgi:hypothetical protein